MNYKQARLNMVQGQLMPCGVSDQCVLSAFLDVERERFLPDKLSQIAYCDGELNVFNRKTVVPFCLAMMFQVAELTYKTSILYVSSCTGYGPAILSELGCDINIIEHEDDVYRYVSEKLHGYDIKVTKEPIYKKYDVIIFEGFVNMQMLEAVKAYMGAYSRAIGVLSDDKNVGYIFRADLHNQSFSMNREYEISISQQCAYPVKQFINQ